MRRGELAADEDAALADPVAGDVFVALRARTDVFPVSLRISCHFSARAVPAAVPQKIPREAGLDMLHGDGVGVEDISPADETALDHALNARPRLLGLLLCVSLLLRHNISQYSRRSQRGKRQPACPCRREATSASLWA